jgi:hypothetical protein
MMLMGRSALPYVLVTHTLEHADAHEVNVFNGPED